MGLSHPKVSRAMAIAGLVGLAALGGGRAQAQHTADPYNPYNQEYESYIFSQYPTVPGAVPNQSILEGRSGTRSANQFQGFVNGMDTLGAEDVYGPRRTGPGVAYYSAYRRYDRDYDRYYEANRSSNQTYYEDQKARNEKYLAFLKERDPRRRAQLFREYTQSSRRATRDLNASRATLTRSGSATRTGTATTPETKPRPKSTAPESAAILGRPTARRAATAPGLNPSTRTRIPTPSEVLRRSRENDRPKSGPLPTPGAGSPTTPAPR